MKDTKQILKETGITTTAFSHYRRLGLVDNYVDKVAVPGQKGAGFRYLYNDSVVDQIIEVKKNSQRGISLSMQVKQKGEKTSFGIEFSSHSVGGENKIAWFKDKDAVLKYLSSRSDNDLFNEILFQDFKNNIYQQFNNHGDLGKHALADDQIVMELQLDPNMEPIKVIGKVKWEQDEGSSKFQVDEFGKSLDRIEPLLSRLRKRRNIFNSIDNAVSWLNESIDPYIIYRNHLEENELDKDIDKLLPNNFREMSKDELRGLASNPTGQELKRAILTKFYPQETPKEVKKKIVFEADFPESVANRLKEYSNLRVRFY